MRYYIYIAVILFLSCLLLHQCDKARRTAALATANQTALTDTVQYYNNSLSAQTAYVKTLQYSEKEIRNLLLSKNAKLKALTKDFTDLKSINDITSTVQFDTIAIGFDSPLVMAADSLARIEKRGTVSAKWYSLGYKVTADSLVLSPFQTHTETTVVTGMRRKWLLGKETLVTEVSNTNPHITVTNIKAAEIVVQPQWYRKWYVWLAAGFAGGLLIR